MEAMTSEREAFEKFHCEIFGQGTIDPSGALFRTWKAACAWNTCNWQARAHLAQPAQTVDVGAIREVIESLSGEANAHDDEGMPSTAAYLSRMAIKLTRALSGEKAGPVGDRWISVDDRLPEPCQFVLASYLNTNGKGRVIRAMYAAPKTLELHMDAEGGEYDEETDTYWCEPGWYEANDNEEIHWFVAEKVTHWMPLPASPTPGKEGA